MVATLPTLPFFNWWWNLQKLAKKGRDLRFFIKNGELAEKVGKSIIFLENLARVYSKFKKSDQFQQTIILSNLLRPRFNFIACAEVDISKKELNIHEVICIACFLASSVNTNCPSNELLHKWLLRFPVRFFLPIYRSLL